MTSPLTASLVLNRFTMLPGQTPESFVASLGVAPRRLIVAWHLHADMKAANEAIKRGEFPTFRARGTAKAPYADFWSAYADRWGKGHWPIDLGRMAEKASDLGAVDLDMEIGSSTWNLVDCSPELGRRRRSAIAHVGRVRRLLAGMGTHAEGVYAMRFPEMRQSECDLELQNDRECHALAGRPSRIVVGCYGTPTLDRIKEWSRIARRAGSLAKTCAVDLPFAYQGGLVVNDRFLTTTPTVVFYVSPWRDARRGGPRWMTLGRFGMQVRAVGNLARQIASWSVPAEVTGWMDGASIVDGKLVRVSVAEAEPYIERMRTELAAIGDFGRN